MNDRDNTVDYSAVLASAVHDMKNSLLLLMQSIEELGSSFPSGTKEAHQINAIHYETTRLNTGLMQLLSLYRAEIDEMPLSINEHFSEEIIDELLASNKNYIDHSDIQINIDNDENFPWYLDATLVHVLLNDMLVNAMRYCKKQILIRIEVKDGFCVIAIEDDGDGYPESMLKSNETSMRDFDISTGRTGLGLFFARIIAEAHTNDDKRGSIHLANGGVLGGSVFTLKLP